MDYYEYAYFLEAGLLEILIAFMVFGWLLSLIGYVFSSIGLCAIAKRRRITKPWLAWIPVVRFWILGSISDQYRYVTKGQIKNKRKSLVILEGVCGVLLVVTPVLLDQFETRMIAVEMSGQMEQLVAAAMAFLPGLLGVLLLSLVVGIVTTVIHHMAMYDLYTSVNPSNSVVFLVLGILFSVTEPFFIFFNRNKDAGMPPRCDIPMEPVVISAPQLPERDPWDE